MLDDEAGRQVRNGSKQGGMGQGALIQHGQPVGPQLRWCRSGPGSSAADRGSAADVGSVGCPQSLLKGRPQLGHRPVTRPVSRLACRNLLQDR